MLLRVLVCIAAVASLCTADLDHGLGKSIAWRSFEAGLAEASTLFVHEPCAPSASFWLLVMNITHVFAQAPQQQADDAHHPQDVVRRLQGSVLLNVSRVHHHLVCSPEAQVRRVGGDCGPVQPVCDGQHGGR